MCSTSGSSRGKDSGVGTGTVGRVNPDDPLAGGLDKVRADGRVPLGTLAALEREELRRLPGRVFEVEGLQDREAFKLLILANVTEYITYMNALDVCSEWLHEFLTLKDGI